MSAKELALNLLIKAKDMASGVVRNFKEEVQDSGQAAEDLERSLDSADDSIDELKESTEDAGKATGHFANQLTDADKAAGHYYDSAGRLHDANGKFVKGAKRARTEADKLGDEFDQTGRKADGLSDRVGGLTGRIKGLFAASAVGAGLKWFFEQSIGSAARFERQMSRVKAVTSATAEEMKRLEAAANEAGSTTEYNAVQAAEGLEILGRAGFAAGESIELLPSVLAVAQAESIGLAEAAGLVSDTLSVMQLEVGKGAKVTDILAKGSSLANTRMTDLGQAISYAGQYAKPANLDLEKLVAILDVLAKNSLRGERGGTGLRSILAQLSDPASKAAQAIKQLNLPTDDFITLIEGLRQKGPEAADAINAFGIEAGPALRALIAAGSEGITELEQKLRDVDGAAKDMADTATDDLIGGVKGAQSAWDGLIKTYSKPLLKPLTQLVDQLASKFREMNESGNLKAWGDVTVVALQAVSGSLKIVYNAFTLSAKAVGVFVTTLLVGVADAERAVAKLMNRVGLVSDETVRKLEVETQALREVLATFVREAEEDVKDIGDGWDSLSDLMAGKVTLGVEKVGEAADQSGQKAKAAGEAAAEGAKTAEQAAKDQAQAQQEAAEAASKFAQAQSDAWETLGHDVDEVTGSLTDSGSAAITAFETIATSGKASAEQIELAFASALAQAKNQEDILALERSLQSMGRKGHAAAEQVATGLMLADRRAKQLANTATNALERSLQALGVDIVKIRTGFSEVGRVALDEFDAIQEELKRTGVAGEQAAEITRDSFESALNQISTAAGLDELKAKLLQAAKEGRIGWDDYRKGLEALEAQYDELEKAAADSIFGQKNALESLEKQAKETAGTFKDKAAFTDKDTAATEQNATAHEQSAYQKWADSRATKDATAANNENAASNDRAAASIDRSTASYRARQAALEAIAGESDQVTAALQRIEDGAGDVLSQFGKLSTNTHSYFNQLRRRADYLRREQEQLIETYQREQAQIERVEQALESGRHVSEKMLDGIRLIDSQKLNGLRESIQRARYEAEQFSDSMSTTVANLRQQLADLRGDQQQSEQIAQEQRMLQLRQSYEEAKSRGNQEAIRSAKEAIGLQQQIYRERMRQLRQSAQEEAAPNALSGSAPARPAPSHPNNAAADTSVRTVRVELALGDTQPFQLDTTESEAERLLSELATKKALS